MVVNCHFCRKPVETTELGVYRKVTGWAKIRAKGGANAVTLPENHDAWAHRSCIILQQRGVSTEQGTLV